MSYCPNTLTDKSLTSDITFGATNLRFVRADITFGYVSKRSDVQICYSRGDVRRKRPDVKTIYNIIKISFMKKLLNNHNNNLKIKNEKHLVRSKSPKVNNSKILKSKAMSKDLPSPKVNNSKILKSKAMLEPTLSKSMMRVEKDFLQQQGKAQAKSRLEEVKKKFINLLMRSGEKSKAQKLFRDSLNLLEKKSMAITALKLSSSISRGDVRVEAVSKGEERIAPPISKGDVNKMLGVTAYKRDSTDKNSSKGQKHGILCDNKAELFKFYTVYNRVEKNGTFKKNEKLKDTSVPSLLLPTLLTSRSDVCSVDRSPKVNKSEICQSDVQILNRALTNRRFVKGVKPKVVLREDLLVQSPSNTHIAKRSYKGVTSHITETMKSPLERREGSVKKGDVKRDINVVMSTRSGVGTKNNVPKSPSSRTYTADIADNITGGNVRCLQRSQNTSTPFGSVKKGSVKSDVTKVIKDFTPKNNKSDNKNNKSDNKNNNSENKNKSFQKNSHNDFLKNHILYQAIENIKPPLELRRVRKGGTTYQVPAIVSQKKQERLAIKWIIESACKRKSKKGNSFSESLVTEILEAFHKTGQPRQKRNEMLKIAEFNRAYTRYRWW